MSALAMMNSVKTRKTGGYDSGPSDSAESKKSISPAPCRSRGVPEADLLSVDTRDSHVSWVIFGMDTWAFREAFSGVSANCRETYRLSGGPGGRTALTNAYSSVI